MASITFKSSLNPHAREFTPAFCALSTQPVSAKAQVADEAQFPIQDLPLEMLSCIISNLSGSGHDLASCLLASQQLQAAAKAARVAFTLSDQQKHVLSNPAHAHRLDALVKGIIKYMPGTVSCSLSMLPLEHSHISSLAHSLSQLTVLDLSGCKKLQPWVTKLLQQPGMLPRLQCLNLQRCFQLTDVCLLDLLVQSSGTGNAYIAQTSGTTPEAKEVASTSGSELQCIALSHLDLSEWPWAAMEEQGSNEIALEAGNTSSCGSFWQQLQDALCSALLSAPGRLGEVASRDLRLRSQPPAFTALGSHSSSLRVVALNNCNHLSVDGLIALAAACPGLEYLMLGGSTLRAWDGNKSGLPALAGMGTAAVEVTAGAYVPPQVAATADETTIPATGSSQLALRAGQELLPPAVQQFAALLDLPAVLPWEVLAACCEQPGGISCQHKSCSCCCSDDSGSSSSSSSKAKVRKQLERSEPPAAALAAARSHAHCLAYVAALMPRLKAIEVTFMAPGVAGWLKVCIRQLQSLERRTHIVNSSNISDCPGNSKSPAGVNGGCSTDTIATDGCSSCACASQQEETVAALPSDGSGTSCSGIGVRVWEFSCIASVQQALQRLEDIRCSRYHTGLLSGVTISSLETALRCAANCSWSRGRSTALHLAAERGCAQHVSALLRAGAAVAARDSSGASPLFVAAEAGRAAAVSVLLEAGADALVSNTAGETALYIASLRGHLRVVEVLLGYLSAAGVDWMQEGLYGDAWTPLMAAAVANRVDVALCLLRAATGFNRAGMQLQGSTGPATGVSRQVAQRQNPAYAYRNKCRFSTDRRSDNDWRGAAGVERLLAAENRYGQTALHIAARKGCRELLRLLLLYGAVQVAGQVVDSAGDTWTDIARRYGHDIALRELLQQC